MMKQFHTVVKHLFGWWVAGCLALLALSTYEQLRIQQRLLAGSRELDQRVAEAQAVTQGISQQVRDVGRLVEATDQLSPKLQGIAALNRSLRVDLDGLSATAVRLRESIQHLDQQAQLSGEQLLEISRQSAILHQSLLETQGAMGAVSQNLSALIEIQYGVNADLAEMVRKTAILDRFVGGGGN